MYWTRGQRVRLGVDQMDDAASHGAAPPVRGCPRSCGRDVAHRTVPPPDRRGKRRPAVTVAQFRGSRAASARAFRTVIMLYLRRLSKCPVTAPANPLRQISTE